MGETALGRIMNASLVIPTYNRREILARVLATYCRQDRRRSDFELIVIDDGSEDDTASLFEGLEKKDLDGSEEIPEKYRESVLLIRRGWYSPPSEEGHTLQPVHLCFIRIAKSGRSVARNIGILLSRNPLIIFADDDIFVERSFVKKHVESHALDDRTVIMGRVIHTGNLENPFGARWKLKDMNNAFLATGNASVLKVHLIDAGLFDEGYSVYGWEDFDLGIHLSERGLKSVKKRICGYHYDPPVHSLEPKRVYEKERERGFSAVYFYTNHPLAWVRRFTLINNRPLQTVVRVLGCRNWFLSKSKISAFRGILRLLIRYKGYFDGVRDGKCRYSNNHPSTKMGFLKDR
jgi:glycosyltransferase involved in cell wall biosynthesis